MDDLKTILAFYALLLINAALSLLSSLLLKTNHYGADTLKDIFRLKETKLLEIIDVIEKNDEIHV